MLLSMSERLLLLDMLPTRSTLSIICAVRDMRLLLGFTAEEIGESDLRKDGDVIVWAKEVGEIDIPMDDVTHEIIKNRLGQLDEAGEVTDEHVSLYQKFGLIG